MPREIVPALIPYSKCTGQVMNAAAAASSGPTSGQAIREAQQRSIVTCSASRMQAKAEAIKLLSNATIAAGSREALVEQVLTAMDHAYDNLADLMDGAPKNLSPKD